MPVFAIIAVMGISKIKIAVSVWTIVFLSFLIVPAVGSVTLEFDYSYDSSGFFDDTTSNGALARATLEAVGDFYGMILDDTLNAISYSPSNGFAGYISRPDSGASVMLNNLSISANTVRIYVGSRDLGVAPSGGNILGSAGPGGYYIYSSKQDLLARGEGYGHYEDVYNDGGETAFDFAPWGGAMSIDADTNWNLDHTAGPAYNEADLYSVIIHEIGHVLGIGISDSWDNLIDDGLFDGAAAKAENGGAAVPVDSGGGHWALGTSSTVFGGYDVQTASMTPSTSFGIQRYFTALDVAGLDDLGWEINYPASVYGDANLDGTVDDVDATIMAANWSVGDTWSQGDFNGDGTVDGDDAALLAANWLISPGGTAVSVPEPSPAVLFLSLFVTAIGFGRFAF